MVTPKPLRLADISVSWEGGSRRRVATGRQIAYLLTAAAALSTSDHCLGADADRTGQWIYKFRGLAGLLTLDGDGVSLHESDSRTIVADLLEQAAAELLADQLDSPAWPTRFAVRIQRPPGAPAPAGGAS